MGINKEKKALNSYAKYSSIAIQMFAIIAIGTFAGIKVDEKFPNKHQIYTVLLSLLSVITAIFFVIRTIISNSKKNNES